MNNTWTRQWQTLTICLDLRKTVAPPARTTPSFKRRRILRCPLSPNLRALIFLTNEPTNYQISTNNS